MSNGRQEERKRGPHNGKNNDGKANFDKLTKYFKDVDWNIFNGAEGVEERWDGLLEI